MKKISLFFVITLYSLYLAGQSRKIDSLQIVLKTEKEDTIKLNTLNVLWSELYRNGAYLKTDSVAESSLQLAKELNFTKGIGYAYKIIGLTYLVQDNYPDAFKYLMQALKIYGSINDKAGQCRVYGNIGLIYYAQNNYDEALKNFKQSLEMASEAGDKQGMGNAYDNIGNILQGQQKYDEALQYAFKSLKINEELNNSQNVSIVFGGIGSIYTDMRNYPEALKYQQLSLKVAEEINDKQNTCNGYLNMGYLLTSLKKYDEARKYLDSAFVLAKHVGSKSFLRDVYLYEAGLDTSVGNYKSAYNFYNKYVMYSDTLKNEEYEKKMLREQLTYEFNKKESGMKAEQDKKDAVAKEASKKQRSIIYAVSGGFLAVLVLSGFVFSQYRQKQRANGLLEEKNRLVAKQKKQVDDAFGQLHEKHKEVTDSINYATRIQRALFKSEEYITKHLPEHFILFKPKDVVSGDFYWGYEKHGYWYVAAVDCTGHGVPGAFLTMLGSAFLNEISLSSEVLTPAEILNRLRDKVIKELSGQGDVKDGMDISLARIQLTKGNEMSVQWAGANNPLWIVPAVPPPPEGGISVNLSNPPSEGREAIELSPDKQPIGYQEGQKPFTNHELTVNKGDMLYLFTDGYADQFGGPKGKKFKYKQLQQLLQDNAQLTTNEQKKVLNKTIEEWKGSLEQTDDVLVIGIKV